MKMVGDVSHAGTAWSAPRSIAGFCPLTHGQGMGVDEPDEAAAGAATPARTSTSVESPSA